MKPRNPIVLLSTLFLVNCFPFDPGTPDGDIDGSLPPMPTISDWEVPEERCPDILTEWAGQAAEEAPSWMEPATAAPAFISASRGVDHASLFDSNRTTVVEADTPSLLVFELAEMASIYGLKLYPAFLRAALPTTSSISRRSTAVGVSPSPAAR